MEQIENLREKVNHLAGIVPVGGQPLDFKMPWHDALMPIGPNLTAVERAVYQCTLVGCSTIWVVCHIGMQPLLRKRLGDAITYPNYMFKNGERLTKTASIFYVPIHPKDKEKRDSLSWSVMYGANSAYKLCKFISRWIIPDKFYCSFPYGLVDDEVLKTNKDLILSHKNVTLSYQGKTVKDGLHLNFTFRADEFKKVRKHIRFFIFNSANDKHNIKNSEYNKAADIKLEEAFKALDLEYFSVVECPWFYDISSWDGYSSFIGAKIPLSINNKLFFHRKEKWNEKV